MDDCKHPVFGTPPMQRELLRLVDVNGELRHKKPGSPEHRLLKAEQVGLINLLTRSTYGLRELSRAVNKYETWAATTLRDWCLALNRSHIRGVAG